MGAVAKAHMRLYSNSTRSGHVIAYCELSNTLLFVQVLCVGLKCDAVNPEGDSDDFDAVFITKTFLNFIHYSNIG